jgi:hypothetical protein
MSIAAPEFEELGGSLNATGENSTPAMNETPPEVALTQMITSSLAAQAVYVAAKLGIADLLTSGPKSADELAQATETHAPSLYRVLRLLASYGVFAEAADRSFALTPGAEPLRSDVPNSLRDVAIFFGSDWHWTVKGHTLYSVRTGKPAWAEVHGEEVFPYFAKNPEASKIFDNAMTSFSTLAVNAVVEAYDFSAIEKIIDIAGGHGRLLSAILRANPSTNGTLFDLAHVLEGAKQREEIMSLGERCQLASGDFFVSVPEKADAYIMKHIIHDWDDERALLILKNIRCAMNSGGRVLLVESVVIEGNGQDFAKVLDIEMLVAPGGKERTASEYTELFANAGLRLTRIVPTKSPYSVIEAVAA